VIAILLNLYLTNYVNKQSFFFKNVKTDYYYYSFNKILWNLYFARAFDYLKYNDITFDIDTLKKVYTQVFKRVIRALE